MTQRSTHENQIRGSVLGMRGRRKLRSPTDHPELREQRAQLLRTRTASIPFTVCVCVFDPLVPLENINRRSVRSLQNRRESTTTTTVVEFRPLFVKRDELFRDRVDFVHTQRLYTCIFAKRRKESFDEFNFVAGSFSNISLSNSPNFVNYARRLRKVYRGNDNKREITNRKYMLRLISRIYLLNIFNIDNDVR